jgi:hypothetical protein
MTTGRGPSFSLRSSSALVAFLGLDRFAFDHIDQPDNAAQLRQDGRSVRIPHKQPFAAFDG